ncbi:MAG: Uma2 family endonuclease [Candidatus Binatia bacterium]
MSESPAQDPGFSVTSYFELVERGLLGEDDHVELLEGLIVASPPQGPLHASVTMCVDAALRKAIGERASIRIQMPLLAGPRSAPEPDVAVVPGTPADYCDRHPSRALLVVEIADTSLPQDRLSKSRIYAHAGVVEYWILDLRARRLEIRTDPDAQNRIYKMVRLADVGETVELAAFSGARIAVAELFPGY